MKRSKISPIILVIIATSKGNFEPVSAGMHVARCVRMYHVGTVEEEFEGKKKMTNKVILVWELPNEMHVFDEAKGEEVRVISKEYTLSMSKKANLRKDLDSWRGVPFTEEEAAEFDVTKLLGHECMVQIIHTESKGNTYANTNVITPVAEGTKVPKQILPSFEFNYENIAETFEEVPEWIQNKIKNSTEFAESGYVPAGAQADAPAAPAKVEDKKPAAKKAAAKAPAAKAEEAPAAKPKF